MRILAFVLLLAVPMAGAAFAEKGGAIAPEPQQKIVKASNPHIQAMNDKAQELAKILTTEEAETLGRIRENFGIIRSIDVARTSVKEAVMLCADKNADMKVDITKRHKAWSDAIGAQLDRQEASLKKSVTEDRFQNPKQINEYLDAIDSAAHYADDSIEKKIVTTPEACKNLMGSMDDTEKVILGLLTDMKWPGDEAATGSTENAN